MLCSPVGDYFSGGIRPLKLAIETQQPRTTPQFGMVKSGANYVMALGPTLKAKAELGIDQVLFCPGGEVQETGASNFMLIDAERVVTPALTTSFLHGVTRDSILTLAGDLGYEVVETDLGEYIIQLAGETPSHIVVPAIHKTKRQIADLFVEKLGIPPSDDVAVLTEAALQDYCPGGPPIRPVRCCGPTWTGSRRRRPRASSSP